MALYKAVYYYYYYYYYLYTSNPVTTGIGDLSRVYHFAVRPGPLSVAISPWVYTGAMNTGD